MIVDNSNNTESIFDEIRKGSKSFVENRFHYYPKENIFKHNKSGNYNTYTIFYTNEKIKRNIELSITNHEDKKLFIELEIKTFRDKNNKYNYMYLYSFLKTELKMPNWGEFTNLSNYEGNSLSEKISNFFKALDGVMDDKLKNIIEGKDWLDIPFDWGPYK
jgi:hypothetical protein